MDMFNQSAPAPYSPGAVALQNAFVNRVFGWMTAGLALTGFIAYYLSANYAMQIAKKSRTLCRSDSAGTGRGSGTFFCNQQNQRVCRIARIPHFCRPQRGDAFVDFSCL